MKTLNELGLMSETGTLEDCQFIVDESQLAVELHGFYTVAELEAAIADLKAINQAFAAQRNKPQRKAFIIQAVDSIGRDKNEIEPQIFYAFATYEALDQAEKKFGNCRVIETYNV